MMSFTFQHIEFRLPKGSTVSNRCGWRAGHAAFWILILCTLTCRAGGQLSLTGEPRDKEHIESFTTKAEGRVHFTDSDLHGKTDVMYTGISDTGQPPIPKFSLYFDAGSTVYQSPSYESQAYVCPVSEPSSNQSTILATSVINTSPPCLGFSVRYTPTGLPMDKMSVVDATIIDGNKDFKFEWQIPFRSPSSEAVIEQVLPCPNTKTCPYTINLGQMNPITITLRNKLPSPMAVRVENVRPTRLLPENDEIWDQESVEPLNSGDTFPIPNGESNKAFIINSLSQEPWRDFLN